MRLKALKYAGTSIKIGQTRDLSSEVSGFPSGSLDIWLKKEIIGYQYLSVSIKENWTAVRNIYP